MGTCASAISKAKNRVQGDNEDEDNQALTLDPNEKPFNPKTDPLMVDTNYWNFASEVDKSHFKLNKIIGTGQHSVIWLVDRRAKVR